MSNNGTEIQETYSDQMQQLLLRAQQGDTTVIGDLRELLDQKPELWKQVGDLAEHAELAMLSLAAGKNLLAREAMQRKLADLKEELTGPSPTPLERLLVNRIAISWLQVHHADLAAAACTANTPQGVYAQRRLDSANRRYLLAIRQLATVRRLLQPITTTPKICLGTRNLTHVPRISSRKIG